MFPKLAVCGGGFGFHVFCWIAAVKMIPVATPGLGFHDYFLLSITTLTLPSSVARA